MERTMNKLRFAILGLAMLVAAASSARAQNQYIGYVYPAGGQQGTTFPIRLGGQGLVHASDRGCERGRGFRSAGRLLPGHGQSGTRVAQPATERVAEEGNDGRRRDGRQDGLVRVPAPSARIGPRSVPDLPVCGTPIADATVCTNAMRSWRNPKTEPAARRANLPSPRRKWPSRS